MTLQIDIQRIVQGCFVKTLMTLDMFCRLQSYSRKREQLCRPPCSMPSHCCEVANLWPKHPC